MRAAVQITDCKFGSALLYLLHIWLLSNTQLSSLTAKAAADSHRPPTPESPPQTRARRARDLDGRSQSINLVHEKYSLASRTRARTRTHALSAGQ